VYTFNLCSEAKADEFIQQAYLFIREKKDENSFRIIERPTQAFFTKENAEAQFLTEWKQEQRSNMEFLMLLNKYSGRSFNDMT
jgi:Beige/BEACH domain